MAPPDDRVGRGDRPAGGRRRAVLDGGNWTITVDGWHATFTHPHSTTLTPATPTAPPRSGWLTRAPRAGTGGAGFGAYVRDLATWLQGR